MGVVAGYMLKNCQQFWYLQHSLLIYSRGFQPFLK